jgi:putative transcriptional regulator
MLRAIFALQADSIHAPPARSVGAGCALPQPLRRLLGFELDQAPWRPVLPGVRECPVGEGPGEVRLISIEAGGSMPPHSHEGAEAMLVLRGGFRDGGRFRRGDVAVIDGRIAHGALADPGEDCVCFAVVNPSPWWAGVADRAVPLRS